METTQQQAAALAPRKAQHSLKQCTLEEIAQFPILRCKLKKLSNSSRGSKVKTDRYVGSVYFMGFASHLDFTLTEAQYELVCLMSRTNTEKLYIPEEFSVDAHVRPVKVAWPANGSQAAHDQYLVDVVLCEDVKLTIEPSKEFVKVLDLLESRNAEMKASLDWFVRIPGEAEKPEAQADKPQSDVGLDQ